MKPAKKRAKVKTKGWKTTQHCQLNATLHGAYSAHVYSARAFLRALDGLLMHLEAQVQKARSFAVAIAPPVAAQRSNRPHR